MFRRFEGRVQRCSAAIAIRHRQLSPPGLHNRVLDDLPNVGAAFL